MEKIITQRLTSPCGELLLGSIEDRLCLCDWRYRKLRPAIDNRLRKGVGGDFVQGTSRVLDRTALQLEEYFAGNRQQFDLPMLTIGTPFQKAVWEELQRVPYGRTLSYQQLAEKMGNKKAVRAVASANGANALSILIPCHRIIGANGQLVGYAGGLGAKKKLLKLENPTFRA